MAKVLIAEIEIKSDRFISRTIPHSYLRRFEKGSFEFIHCPSPRGLCMGNGFLANGWDVVFCLRRNLMECVKEENPDLVLFAMIVARKWLRELREKGIGTWFWYRDVFYEGWNAQDRKFRRALRVARLADNVSSMSMETCRALGKMAEKTVHFFPEPIDLDLFNRKDVPGNKEFDVAFHGTLTEHRWNIIQKVKAEFNFLGIGKSFGRRKRVYYNQFPSSLEARINLNLGRGRPYKATLSTRIPRMLACGEFVLSERGDLEPFDGKCIGFFDAGNDVVGNIRYWLNHEKERNEISLQGMEFVRRNFGTEKIAQKILKIATGG